MTDAGLIDVAIGCGKTLKSLGIAACEKITDTSMEAVGAHCNVLESLSLDSELIHNKGVIAVAQGCSLLKVLKLQCINVSDEALLAVGTCCWSLELLALYGLQQFTDQLVALHGYLLLLMILFARQLKWFEFVKYLKFDMTVLFSMLSFLQFFFQITSYYRWKSSKLNLGLGHFIFMLSWMS